MICVRPEFLNTNPKCSLVATGKKNNASDFAMFQQFTQQNGNRPFCFQKQVRTVQLVDLQQFSTPLISHSSALGSFGVRLSVSHCAGKSAPAKMALALFRESTSPARAALRVSKF